MNEHITSVQFGVPKLSVSIGDVVIQGGADVRPLSVSENGTYREDGVAYSPVTVSVPQPSGTKQITVAENGIVTEDVEQYEVAEIIVDVPNTYTEPDEGKVVDGGKLVSQTGASIDVNGTYNTTTNDEVVVNVPNTYEVSDEGKVVDNGALVGQTSRNVTNNGVYDTTLNDEVVVNVQPPLEQKSVTPTKQAQTVEPTAPNYGLSSVTVNPIPAEYIAPSGTQSISANGQYDITDKASVDVNVPNPSIGTLNITENGVYDVTDKASADVQVRQPSGTKQIGITQNGQRAEDVEWYENAEISVNVPNTYTASDEGKVVSSGALVSQTSRTVAGNGTYDTTTNNQIVVNNEDYSEALAAFGVTGDLANGIEAMTTYANETTGASDTTLSDAVRTLADGYGWSEPDYDDVTLPPEYQRVEYIEGTGTQYIEVPIGFYPTDEVHARMSIDRFDGNEKTMVCPIPFNSGNNRYALCAVQSNRVTYGFGGSSTNNTMTLVASDTEVHDHSYAGRIFLSKDMSAAIGVGGITFGSTTANIRLFYGYSAATKGKIRYYVHHKEDGTGVALYACYRKSDGVIGMYDVDNDVFYTNDGSGTFIKGQDI